MARHSDEAADRALFNSMMPKGKDGAVLVNTAGTPANAPAQIGEVPNERTIRKPQAYLKYPTRP